MSKRIPIEGQDYCVRVVDFGNSAIDGCIVSSPDDFANIYINSRICHERKIKAYNHELKHLMNDDLYSPLPVSIIENSIH